MILKAFGLIFIILDLIFAQTIELNLGDKKVIKENDNLTLQCSHDSIQGPKNYTWFLDDKIINDNEHFHQYENGILKILNVQKEHSGFYSCLIHFTSSGAKLKTPHEKLNIFAGADGDSDSSGMKSNQQEPKLDSTCLFRLPKLCRDKRNKAEDSVDHLVILTVNESSVAVMECELENIKKHFYVKWIKDGKELLNEHLDFKLTTNSTTKINDNNNNSSNSNISKYSIDPITHKLTIHNVKHSDEGVYDCAMLNDKQEFVIKSKKRFDLQIRASLKFTPKPSSKKLEMGSTAKIHCKTNGINPSILWRRELDEDLPPNVEDINGTLIFSNVTLEIKGQYTCIASTQNEQIKVSINIDVVVGPKFEVTPPSKLNVVEMQTVIIDCQASGFPKPTIQWDHDKQYVTNDSEDDRFKVYENGTLVLNEARQEDEGTYGCTIGNAAGLKRRETILTVKSMDSHTSYEDAEKENGFVMTKAVFITIFVAVAYIVLVVALMLWCRYKRQKNRDGDLEKDGNDDTRSDIKSDEKEPLKHPSSSTHNSTMQAVESSVKLLTESSNEHLMLKRDQLIDLKKLGRGQFGGEILTGRILEADIRERFKQTLQNGDHKLNHSTSNHKDINEIRSQDESTATICILVKQINKIKFENAYAEFRRQAEIFKSINHENVVRLIGLNLEKECHQMILEHSDLGDLKQYLATNTEKLPYLRLLEFAYQATRGLEAFSKLNLTHSDLACRNCNISSNFVVKISFITLNKDKYSNEYYKYKNKLIPLRYMAPESIKRDEYSIYSDIYSCGILIWECLIQAKYVPFDSLDNENYLKAVQADGIDYKNLVGFDELPDKIKNVLLSCWISSPKERPRASQLVNSLDELLHNEQQSACDNGA